MKEEKIAIGCRIGGEREKEQEKENDRRVQKDWDTKKGGVGTHTSEG